MKTILSSLKPEFTFAGYTWPRHVARIQRGALSQRLHDRKASCCGEYHHAPKPNASSKGFYLASDGDPGLRWRWCDDVDHARIGHTAWFTDESGDGEKIRGVVFRLTHGRGFVPGWSMGEGMASEIDYSQLFDSEIDAAHCANSMAENAAESEREYQASQREEDEEPEDE